MEVFVSKKDKDFIDACLSETNCYLYIQDELQGEILKLKSLDQHDAETKTPLEEEIVRLKQYVIDINKDNNRLREKLNVTVKDHFDPTTWEKQARQKVIAELEEWCDINEQFGVHNEKYIKDLQRKLNEMKGEKDE